LILSRKSTKFVIVNHFKKQSKYILTVDEGLRKIGSSTTEFTLADYPTVDDRLSNEVLKSSDRLKQEVNNEQV
jgi:hypothetical protein